MRSCYMASYGEGAEAARVRELLGDRISDGRLAMTRIAVKGRKR